MKTKLFNILVTIGLISVLSVSHSVAGESGGGGDAAEVEFANIGASLVKALKDDVDKLEYSLATLEEAVKKTTIVMVRHKLFKGDRQRDARNYPEELRIDVDRGQWVKLLPNQKAPFVYHEYLAVAGIENDTPTVSRNLNTLLSSEIIKKIVLDAAPEFEFQCELSRQDPHNGLDIKRCGSANLSTASFSNKSSAYFHDCGQISVSLRGGKFTGYMNEDRTNFAGFAVQMSHLEKGSEDNWERRSPDEYSSFVVDPYSVPNQFAIGLTTHEGFPLIGQKMSYHLSCKRN